MEGKRITVMGLGPMGRAMAGAYLDRGYEVTVWNRTPSRADALVERGANRAGTVEAALTAGGPVVLSLTDHDAAYAVLGQAVDALRGRTVANLTSDTPRRSREVAEWVRGHGGAYLTGAALASPRDIGRPESVILYSGPGEVLQAHREALEVLGRADHRGEDPGAAALLYQLNMDMFWTSMVSYLHAAAVAEANGIAAEDIGALAAEVMASLPEFIAFYTPRIAAGEHPGDADRLSMGAASVDHVLRTTQDAGVDGLLPAAVLEVFRRGMAAGRQEDSFTSLLDVFRRPVA
ncbi:3-hydroxyisobutyrate dehydrogenase-like beta-hydroxyacid dehydrogenase [Nocardiopsis sp. Huas11]|uniref:NAD(P)-dependent oxidoreductase n=1 Tax=Nocardiopsis sp. Huas11 TaxID=2183912 RepID=UPI000EAD0B15|nr:NAD(P)-binding domain-containing protein [Nocardiopsis sp. Huas11]RKS04655.1 3-hydroxyisobutyrate dehydrogenase-like beta-hydroxyacid dehydrogenase [Nocardiopsis sp. Huas11]